MNYDFLILSQNEFENISRDLLQKKLFVFIESFTSGPDSGIDLRCTTDKDKKVIIQAKRYKSYTSLLSNLKKEVEKVKKLSPDRYIITTSIGLTPNNKNTIKLLFTPFIKETNDIFGRDDLNNLIGTNPDIERQYYKLWLSSVNILDKVLHSKVYNQSAFELEDIKEKIKLYVQNDSFDEALKILKEHRYLIISGIPGIGKTTLARVIVLYLLSNDFEEFVYLSQSIDEGYELFVDDKKQVFFFDDFLGKNFLENKLLRNEDNKIVKFIDKINKSHNKVLIFTTREYILNQAKSVSEEFSTKNIEIAKCILDLSSYTNIIKAQILYNHLFFAQVPVTHITNLIENKSYLKLVRHKNYNPRIIEAIINQKIWEGCLPDKFANSLISFFDNPESVWLRVYQNTLNKLSQSSLLVLLTMGTPVLLDDWEKATREFVVNNNFLMNFDSIQFKSTIKELENTFIISQVDSNNIIAIEYQNPSIQDFLVNYLKENKNLIRNLLKSNVFSNQFFRVFTTDKTKNLRNSGKILLNTELSIVAINRIINKYLELNSSNIIRLNLKGGAISWYKSERNQYSILDNIKSTFGKNSVEIDKLIYKEFQKLIYFNDNAYLEQTAYFRLLSNLELDKLKFNENKLIDSFIKNIDWVDRLEFILEFEAIFPVTFKKTIQSSYFKTKIESVIKIEIENTEDSGAFDLKEELSKIESMFNVNLSEEIDELDQLGTNYEGYIESQLESHIEERKPGRNKDFMLNENEVIGEIFKSLL